MLKKIFFIASVIILIVAYVQLSSFHTAIQQALPIIIINSNASSTEAEATIKSLFIQCDIEFQSTLVPEIYVRTESDLKTYYRLSHLRKPVHQSIVPLIKELKNSQKASAHNYYLLESPTHQALKQLRLNIERNFKGAARVSAFDRVIPILSIAVPPSSNLCEPVKNYMTYAKQNFGGAGFLI